MPLPAEKVEEFRLAVRDALREYARKNNFVQGSRSKSPIKLAAILGMKLSTWNRLFTGSTVIDNNNVYAKVMFMTGNKVCDPRLIPPREIYAGKRERRRSTFGYRHMSDQNLVDWVEKNKSFVKRFQPDNKVVEQLIQPINDPLDGYGKIYEEERSPTPSVQKTRVSKPPVTSPSPGVPELRGLAPPSDVQRVNRPQIVRPKTDTSEIRGMAEVQDKPVRDLPPKPVKKDRTDERVSFSLDGSFFRELGHQFGLGFGQGARQALGDLVKQGNPDQDVTTEADNLPQDLAYDSEEMDDDPIHQVERLLPQLKRALEKILKLSHSEQEQFALRNKDLMGDVDVLLMAASHYGNAGMERRRIRSGVGLPT